MTTFTVKHFDVLDFVEKSKSLGVDEKVAIFQARQIEQAIDIAVAQIENKELTTKKDLAELKLELVKWVVGVGIVSVSTLSGIIFTLLKLMIH